MFNREYFQGPFPDRLREFAKEHRVTAVKVEVVTHDGRNFNVKHLVTDDIGAQLLTVDDLLILLPYHEIGRIEVSAKGVSTQVGFAIPGVEPDGDAADGPTGS